MSEIIIRDLIEEMVIWESQSKWPPNRTMLRRALHTLGHDHNWSDVHLGLSSSEAWAKRAKERRQRGKDKWGRIARAIEIIEQRERDFRKPAPKPWGATPKANSGSKDTVVIQGDPNTPKKIGVINGAHMPAIMGGQEIKFSDGYVAIDEYVRNIIIKGAHTPDTDPRAVATLKREIKNKDALIAQKKREYENLLNKNKGGANTQADLIGRQQAEIDEYKKKIRSLDDKIADMKLVHSIEGTKQTLNKEITRLRAENIRQQEKAQKYYALYEDAAYKLDNTPDSDDVQKLEQQVHDLSVELHNAKNKAANKQIDFQYAISGLMSGRVLQPEIPNVSITDNDIYALMEFKQDWEFALDTLPDTHVYGMKNKESGICKRHGIIIDDYGQPTAPVQLQDFARTLQYMDNAIAHAHQEIQAAARVADMLIKAGK